MTAPGRDSWALEDDGVCRPLGWSVRVASRGGGEEVAGRGDPAVGGLRLSGVFPLDDAERALRALEPALPIVVSRHTQYWLQVGPRAA